MTRAAIIVLLAAAMAGAPAAAQAQSAAAKARAEAQAERDRERERAAQERERERERIRERIAQERERRGDDRRFEQTETFAKIVKIGAQGELDVQNMSGSITVTRGSGNDVTIEATKKAHGSSDEAAREMLQLVRVDVIERAGRVEVRTRYPNWDEPGQQRVHRRNVNVSVTYNITAPAGTRLRVHSMSGGITVSDIAGELNLEAMSGGIKIERAARVLTAKTMSGNVSMTDARSDGLIDTSSMSGTVTLNKVRARRINVWVVSGHISLIDTEAERIDAQTTSGHVTYEGTLARNGRYKFMSHSGHVKMALAGDTGFELDANSFSGHVRSDIALKQTDTTVADIRRRGRPEGRTKVLRGTYGDGSAVLDLTTFSGTIVVTKRGA
jgi:hypothetical protein